MNQRIDPRDLEISRLRDQLEMLQEQVLMNKAAASAEDEFEILGKLRRRWGLSNLPARALLALFRAGGRVISREGLMTTLYADRPDDEPNTKIIDVMIVKLRRQLGQTTILTVSGIGYAMSADGIAACEQVLATPSVDLVEAVQPMTPRRVTMVRKMLERLKESPATSRTIAGTLNRTTAFAASYLHAQVKRGHVAIVEEGMEALNGRRLAALWALTEDGAEYLRRVQAAD